MIDQSHQYIHLYNLNMEFYIQHRVDQILPSLKDKINKFDQRGVVYKIPCLDCTGVYIGEIGRSFKTRRKEHQRDVKPDIIAKLTNEELKRNLL